MNRQKFKIIPFAPQYLQKVLHIANKTLGAGYVKKENLLSPAIIAHVAIDLHDEVLGFSCGKIIETELLSRATHKKYPEFIIRQLPAKKDIGLTLSLAVDSNHQKQGIGLLLFKMRNTTFKQHGAAGVLMPGWQKPDGSTSIKPLAEKSNFTPLGTIKNFFYHDSIKNEYTCPVCGPPPCLCRAVIYWKEIEDEEG